MRLAHISICFALTAPAGAQFSVSGGGDVIPDHGGGWDFNNVDHAFFDFGEASVFVPEAVHCIDSVTIEDLAHPWVGDIMFVLRDPVGVGHVLTLRPRLLFGASFGCNDTVSGEFTFVAPGTSAAGPMHANCPGSLFPGTYDQAWDTGAGITWPEGDENTFGTPMNEISGPAGHWTLEIHDFAGPDAGRWSAWTLNGNRCKVGTSYCGPAANNSTGQSGTISAIGSAAILDNDVRLVASALPPGQFGIFLAGPGQMTTMPATSCGTFCLDGGDPALLGRFLQDLFTVPANGSASLAIDLTAIPTGGAPMALVPGDTWNFQAWHRDDSQFCAQANNFTDAVSIVFQ
ncbi:MAG: hypothetical protein GY711_08165 [bacterium]|nr:hypothetical protein [bacterium]